MNKDKRKEIADLIQDEDTEFILFAGSKTVMGRLVINRKIN